MFTSILNRYRIAFSGLPREIWLLSLVMLINRCGSMVLPFLAIYTSIELGMGDALAGWIIAIFGMGSCVGSFSGGYLSDRFGPFRVQIGSLILNAIGFAALSQMTSFTAFAVTIFLTSAAADVFRPANGAAITLLTGPALHKKAFALNRLAINLGFTIGPTVGGLLASISYQFLFWIDAGTSLLAAIVFVAMLGQHMAEHTSHDKTALADGVESQSPWRDGRFLAFLFLTLGTFCVFFQLMSTFPLFLKSEYRLDEMRIGILFGLNTLIVVACEMVLVQAIDRIHLLRSVAVGSFLMCLGFGILPFGSGFFYATFTVIIWTVGEMFGMPQMFAYVAAISSRENRSRYLSLYTTTTSLAFLLGPLIGTQLYRMDHVRFWHWGSLMGCLVFVGFLMLEKFDPRCQSSPKAETLEESVK